MRKLLKVLLGVLSLSPVVFFVAFFGWLIPAFFDRSGGEVSLFKQRFAILFPLAVATSLVLIGLTIVYIVLLARRPDLQVGEKIAVPAGIIFTNGILLPFVWWLYIWRESNLAALSKRAPN